MKTTNEIKETYIKPSSEVICFNSSDIITTSSNEPDLDFGGF